ncbi:MAG: mitochondrial fission ELM1 family protein [Rhizobiales bacterium]|nr:mitochondrial fission ELM1 family protein [Hyphomicrobiales bacterium]MBI3674785.1 mitochondrial fission ELM1 family protein [Hyphomicrobiales bacterium]
MNTPIGTSPPRIWLLMSHRTGDNTQLLALAEALGLPFHEKRLAYRPAEWLPRILLGATLIGLDQANSTPLDPPYPDLIIGAGRRTEAVALWIRRHLNPAARLVYLGTPWARLDRFDLVITTPQYRLPVLPNVLHNTLPLHNVWPERLAAAARQWQPTFAGLPKPWTAVLAGGDSGPYRFGPEAAARLAREASDRARSRDGSLLVTTSARTSPAATHALFDGLTAPAHCHRWQPDQPANPFHAYLAMADEIIVTADSISMITEACATGKPTHLFDIESGRRSMRAEESAARKGSRLPPPHWKGANFTSTLWRLGLIFGPDWWTRDIRIVHRELIASGRAAWLGNAVRYPGLADPAQDMGRAVARVRDLMGIA